MLLIWRYCALHICLILWWGWTLWYPLLWGDNNYVEMWNGKKVVAITILVVATSHSVLAVCYGIVLYSLIDIIISTKFNKIYMGITICGIFLSIKNALIVSIIQFAVISFVVNEINNPFLSILVAVILSLVIVLLIAFLLRFKEFDFWWILWEIKC